MLYIHFFADPCCPVGFSAKEIQPVMLTFSIWTIGIVIKVFRSLVIINLKTQYQNKRIQSGLSQLSKEQTVLW